MKSVTRKRLEENDKGISESNRKIEKFSGELKMSVKNQDWERNFAAAIAVRVLAERAERGKNEQTTGKETI